jgi:hypothetical protein
MAFQKNKEHKKIGTKKRERTILGNLPDCLESEPQMGAVPSPFDQYTG